MILHDEEIVGDLSSNNSASMRMKNLRHRKQNHTEDEFEALIQKGYFEGIDGRWMEDGKIKI